MQCVSQCSNIPYHACMNCAPPFSNIPYHACMNCAAQCSNIPYHTYTCTVRHDVQTYLTTYMYCVAQCYNIPSHTDMYCAAQCSNSGCSLISSSVSTGSSISNISTCLYRGSTTCHVLSTPISIVNSTVRTVNNSNPFRTYCKISKLRIWTHYRQILMRVQYLYFTSLFASSYYFIIVAILPHEFWSLFYSLAKVSIINTRLPKYSFTILWYHKINTLHF